MLADILSFYIQGLLLTSVLVFLLGGLWLLIRAIGKKDKTVKERQAVLYEALLMGVMTIPILSFAMMGLLIMLRV